MGERGIIRLPMKFTTRPGWSKRWLRVLRWTLLPDCRCSSQSLGPCCDWMNVFVLGTVPTPCIKTLKDVLKSVEMCYLFQTCCWSFRWDGLLFKHIQAFIPSALFSSLLFFRLQLATLVQGSHPLTHLSRPDILSRYQHFSKLLVSAIAPLLSSGLLHFLTRCTFILPAPSACSPGAQLPSKYTEIRSPAEVTLQRSQRRIYRPAKFPAYLPLH